MPVPPMRNFFSRYQELADPSQKQKWPIWTCTLGEIVYDIQTVETTTPSATTIHVLGERNYYCFQGNGVLWFMKRLQYTPSCFHPYITGALTVNAFTQRQQSHRRSLNRYFALTLRPLDDTRGYHCTRIRL